MQYGHCQMATNQIFLYDPSKPVGRGSKPPGAVGLIKNNANNFFNPERVT